MNDLKKKQQESDVLISTFKKAKDILGQGNGAIFVSLIENFQNLINNFPKIKIVNKNIPKNDLEKILKYFHEMNSLRFNLNLTPIEFQQVKLIEEKIIDYFNLKTYFIIKKNKSGTILEFKDKITKLNENNHIYKNNIKNIDELKNNIIEYIENLIKLEDHPNIKINKIIRHLNIDKNIIIELLENEIIRKLEKDNPNIVWFIDGMKLHATFPGGNKIGILKFNKSGGISFKLLGIKVSANWELEKFDLICSVCNNKNKFIIHPNFRETGLIRCRKCKETLIIPDFKKYF